VSQLGPKEAARRALREHKPLLATPVEAKPEKPPVPPSPALSALADRVAALEAALFKSPASSRKAYHASYMRAYRARKKALPHV
jgi:hypothetical protein